MDSFHCSDDQVAALLERGVRVLIYVGTYDWICNWIGNERWTLDLQWSGREEFVKEELRPWTVNGEKVGLVRSKNGLSFVTVDAAGHMVR
jgi:carboxypeptidase C (cathepsin A)